MFSSLLSQNILFSLLLYTVVNILQCFATVLSLYTFDGEILCTKAEISLISESTETGMYKMSPLHSTQQSPHGAFFQLPAVTKNKNANRRKSDIS